MTVGNLPYQMLAPGQMSCRVVCMVTPQQVAAALVEQEAQGLPPASADQIEAAATVMTPAMLPDLARESRLKIA